MEGESFEPGNQEFFRPLLLAFDALAYSRFKQGSGIELSAAHDLWLESPRGTEEVRKHITLSDPLQVKIIDALAEIASILHEREQSEIEIPEKLVGSNFTTPVWDHSQSECGGG